MIFNDKDILNRLVMYEKRIERLNRCIDELYRLHGELNNQVVNDKLKFSSFAKAVGYRYVPATTREPYWKKGDEE